MHVSNTGLYKLSQKGLWSDTSPWCSLSERARTLIYNSLLVTCQTQHFFFAKRNAGCQCCFLLKVSVNLAYFYVLISPPSLPPTPTPLPKTSTTPAWLAKPLHCHIKLVCVIKWWRVKRLGKSLEIGQNASESVPLFHEYTTYKLRSPSWVFDLPQGYRTVPRKSWISELFRPHLEISTEPFLMGLEVSFLGVIFAS